MRYSRQRYKVNRNAPTIAIVGAGAIGGWIAGRLALGGHEPTMFARGETLRRLGNEGLILEMRGEARSIPLKCTADSASVGRQHVVIIAVKAPALATVVGEIRPMIGPGTVILPMLNGVPWWFSDQPLRSVDPEGSIARALPMKQVVGCVVHASCRRTAPNRVEVVHADKLILGEPDGGTSDRVGALSRMFEQADIACEQSDNVRRAIWYKLWGNATINPLSALTRSTADKLLGDPVLRALMAQAMDELAAVGAAIDCPISETAEDRMAVTARLGAFKSSMLQDVEAGRAIELEALVGAPREIARRCNIQTPQLDRIYAITRLLAENLGLI